MSFLICDLNILLHSRDFVFLGRYIGNGEVRLTTVGAKHASGSVLGANIKLSRLAFVSIVLYSNRPREILYAGLK